jgi:hypothetical protein
MASNRFWHIVSVVKEQSPPVQQKGTATAKGVSQRVGGLSTSVYDNSGFSTDLLNKAVSLYPMLRCARGSKK